MAKQPKLLLATLCGRIMLSTAAAIPLTGFIGVQSAFAVENTANEFAKAGERALSTGNYTLAADNYAKAAVSLASSADQQELKTFYLQSQSEALFRQGDERGDNEALKQAIALQQSLLASIDRSKSPVNFVDAENDLANSLTVLGYREADDAHLKLALSTFEDVVSLRDREKKPIDWARTQNDFGMAKLLMGKRSGGDGPIDESIALFRAAADVCGRNKAPTEWARSRSNLGRALQYLGQRHGDLEMLNEASDVLDDAMKVRTRAKAPKAWAESELYLANAKREIGSQLGDQSLMLTALHLYSEALEVFTQEAYPLEWAQVKLDLGNAQLDIGQQQDGLMYLSLAVDSYRDALKERTPERTPLQWGMTQNNLGAALVAISSRESTTANLKNAIAADRAALTQITFENDPLNWAMMKRNLGSNLLDLWRRERNKRQKDFEAANAAIMEQQAIAKVPATLEDHEKALQDMADREAAAEITDEAIEALRDASKVYTRQSRPADWATTQHYLIDALTLNAFTGPDWKNKGTARNLEAISICKELQKVYSPLVDPIYWGHLQYNIGESQLAIGNTRDDIAYLKDATNTLRETQVYQIAHQDKDGWESTLLLLYQALDKLGDKETDVGSYLEAASVLDKLKAIKTADEGPEQTSWMDGVKAEILKKVKLRNG